MRAEVFRIGEWNKLAQMWWYRWHGNAINEKLLSRFGVAILGDDQLPLAIAFIYPVSTCNIAWIGFTVRDPALSKYAGGKAIKLLIEAAEDAIRSIGYSIVYTTYDAPALLKIVKERGYEAGSQVQEYFKELK